MSPWKDEAVSLNVTELNSKGKSKSLAQHFRVGPGEAGLPRRLSGKESTCRCRTCKRRGWIPELGRSPGIANGNLCQHCCLGNSMDRAWQATVREVTKTGTQLRDTAHTHTHTPGETTHVTIK